ncbi:MAG TPA: restriction endonuclease [Steroidobacteraceae bacterium]|nr:restriction endonuclease [Steroidobacteraceae bacterium]
MHWGELEKLIGRAFRRRGFIVTGFGAGGSQGGGDLALMRNGERFLVQCRHWRKQQVDVTMLRELSEVLRAVGARAGYVITAGEFSREAREFARSARRDPIARLELIDGDSLLALIHGPPIQLERIA